MNGKAAAAEMHIASSNGNRITGLGILFDIGGHNDCLEDLLDDLPLAGCERPIESFDLRCFSHQLEGPYWRYTGSLSKPPCTEGVPWTVMRRRATLSKQQLHRLSERYEHNARATQSKKGREITYHRMIEAEDSHCD